MQNKTAVPIFNETEQIIQTTEKSKVHNIKQSPPFTSINCCAASPHSLSRRSGEKPAQSWTRTVHTDAVTHQEEDPDSKI